MTAQHDPGARMLELGKAAAAQMRRVRNLKDELAREEERLDGLLAEADAERRRLMGIPEKTA